MQPDAPSPPAPALQDSDLRAVFDAIEAGCCVIELLYDAEGRAFDHRFLAVNAAFEAHTGLTGAEGKRAQELNPTREAHWAVVYDGVVRTGVPARVTAEARGLGRWFQVSASRLGGAGSRKLVLLFEDVTAERDSRDALVDAQTRLALTLAAGEVGTWTWDVKRDAVVADRNFARLFNVSDAAAAGGPLATYVERVHPDDRAHVQNVIRDALASSSSYEAEYRIVRTESDTRWVVARGSVEHDEEVRPARLSGVVLDVTERKRAEESLRHADRQKDEFLATASHELRTPLNAILGWVRLMRAGKLDASQTRRGVEVIERNALAQVRVIEDILDGSRIITGKLRLEVRLVDLTVLVSSALDAVRAAAEAKQIELTMQLDQAAARFTGDADRLQQVVWNLAHNAIKFTPKGGRVHVRLERVRSHIELTVQDSGQGIPADFLPHVFERFRQLEATTTRRHGGLGLGLALVRHLAEAHGGSVRAESQGEGHGSTFVVSLPVRAVVTEQPSDTEARVAPAVELAVAPGALDGVRALVVDDETDARELVATVLRASGAEVTLAASAEQALGLLEAAQPMVIVSDVGMPLVDGYELLRRVRATLPGTRVPAVALTAYAREEDRRLALAAGFQSHLSKPVEPAELVRVVARLVSTLARSAPDAGPKPSSGRADSLAKLERVLSTQGIHAALRFLNSRTPHRFTGLYRIAPPR